VVSKELKNDWICAAHYNYVEEKGTLPFNIQVNLTGSPIILSMNGPPPQFGSHDSALFDAFRQASSAQMQLGTELAEVFRTAATITSVVKESLRFIVDFKKSLTSRRHRRRFIRRVLNRNADDVASAYMAFRFGIRPLVYATQSALDLHNEGIKKPLLFHGSGSSSQSFSDNDYTCDETVRQKLTYAVVDPELFARAELGLSTSEIASTAWELFPLSWALDYILPIGDYIQMFFRRMSNTGVQFVNSVHSIKSHSYFSSSSLSERWPCYGQRYAFTESTNLYRCDHYQRTVSLTEPFPPIIVNFPVDLNPWQVLDLMALARGFTR